MDGSNGTGSWYPDPTGRFEFRWHNGVAWTGDVASDGHRFLDPLAAHPFPESERNGRAVASLVIGLVCIALAWVPFAFTVAAIASVAGVVLAALALRHPHRLGRPMAIWGLVLSVASMAALPVGWWLSIRIIDRLDRGSTPGPYEIAIDDCDTGRFSITLHGTITNRDSEAHGYAVTVHYLVDGVLVASDRATTATVEPGGSTEFVTIGDHRVENGRDAECRIAEVTTDSFAGW